ncbi:MAG: cobalamin biosynthesis protein CobD [Lachnospiraceae bacterium]|nr:cobalamin biosynthesis protein CobD [Lachnospiraceae bacterium]
MKYHMIAFFLGFLLDLLFGDPYWLPHPIRFIGSLIAKVEKCFLDKNKVRNGKKELRQGIYMVIIVLFSTMAVTTLILFLAYYINCYLGIAVETVMTYQILATKCLKVESMKVYHCLKDKKLPEARKAVSMIVGRDTEALNEEGVAKAAIETVAENTSDGVIAPMLYTALGGPILGFLYKAVNTMDSMIGYKNDKYLYVGRTAAKLDDVVNFLPARISAYLMIAASFVGGKCFSGKRAYYIYKRDNQNHASPNSAQTESVCAGALGIQLAGDASYFGKIVKKPYIGDRVRAVECEDIKKVNRLMYLTAWLSELICLLALGLMCVVIRSCL